MDETSNGEKKNKKIQKNLYRFIEEFRTNININKWHIKFSLFAFIFLSLIIEFSLGIDYFELRENVTQIIVILLPAIFSILSFAISATKSQIYSVEVKELKTLQNHFAYSVNEMFVCTFGAIILFVIFSFSGLNLSSIFVNVISLIFAVIFIKQELKFITKDDKQLMKMIKNNIIIRIKNNTTEIYDENEILCSVLQFLILTKGIKNIFNSLKFDDDKFNRDLLVGYLLKSQNFYNKDFYMKFEILTSEEKRSFKGVKISNYLQHSLDNIMAILTDDYYFNLVFKDSLYDYTYVSHTLLYLQTINKNKLVDPVNNWRFNGAFEYFSIILLAEFNDDINIRKLDCKVKQNQFFTLIG